MPCKRDATDGVAEGIGGPVVKVTVSSDGTDHAWGQPPAGLHHAYRSVWRAFRGYPVRSDCDRGAVERAPSRVPGRLLPDLAAPRRRRQLLQCAYDERRPGGRRLRADAGGGPGRALVRLAAPPAALGRGARRSHPARGQPQPREWPSLLGLRTRAMLPAAPYWRLAGGLRESPTRS